MKNVYADTFLPFIFHSIVSPLHCLQPKIWCWTFRMSMKYQSHVIFRIEMATHLLSTYHKRELIVNKKTERKERVGEREREGEWGIIPYSHKSRAEKNLQNSIIFYLCWSYNTVLNISSKLSFSLSIFSSTSLAIYMGDRLMNARLICLLDIEFRMFRLFCIMIYPYESYVMAIS